MSCRSNKGFYRSVNIPNSYQVDILVINKPHQQSPQRYFLFVININTRFLYVKPLKNRTSQEIIKALESLLNEKDICKNKDNYVCSWNYQGEEGSPMSMFFALNKEEKKEVDDYIDKRDKGLPFKIPKFVNPFYYDKKVRNKHYLGPRLITFYSDFDSTFSSHELMNWANTHRDPFIYWLAKLDEYHTNLAIINRVIRTIRNLVDTATNEWVSDKLKRLRNTFLFSQEQLDKPKYTLNNIPLQALKEIVAYYNHTPHDTLSSLMGFPTTPFMVDNDFDMEMFIVRKVRGLNAENRNISKFENGEHVKVKPPAGKFFNFKKGKFESKLSAHKSAEDDLVWTVIRKDTRKTKIGLEAPTSSYVLGIKTNKSQRAHSEEPDNYYITAPHYAIRRVIS
jgi:hypothetical protein